MKQILKKKRGRRAAWICTLLITPMPAGVMVPVGNPEGGGVTSVEFGAGAGSYRREVLVYGGVSSCAEIWVPVNFDADFVDAGGEIDHQYSDRGHIGVRGGYVREQAALESTPGWSRVNTDSIARDIDPTEDYIYVNPFVAYESEYFGAGVGVIFSNGALKIGDSQKYPAASRALPSAHLRVGSLSEIYGLVSFGESVPIYSGGGMMRAGIGIQPVRFFDAWGGIGVGPWPGRSYLLSVGLHPTSNWSVNTNLRFRSSEDRYRELGMSVGMTFRFGR